MRTILGIVFALVAFPVNAIVVTGEANSYELAQEQAFKQAIDHEVGVIVDTERFAVDSELVHNQILTYSAGYILDYKIISYRENNGVHTVTMDVTVASSRLKNFLLSRASYEGKFLGDNIKTQIRYYQQGLLDGDKLLVNTLKYFPHEAFNVDMREYSVIVDENRKVYLEIPYVITWDKEYLDALKELFSVFASPDPQRNYVQFDDGRFYFYDRVFMQHILKRMERTEFVQIKLNNMRGEPLINKCVQNIRYNPMIGWDGRLTMYGRRDNGITIYEEKIIQNYIVVPIDAAIHDSLQDVSQIHLTIASNKDCP